MEATQPHRLAVPTGKQFASIMANYLKRHSLTLQINPLLTAKHMNYDHGLFESLSVFLTIIMMLNPQRQSEITNFLNGSAMLDLHNEEYRLNSEDGARRIALRFVLKAVK